MSADAHTSADLPNGTDDLETWMQLIDRETLDWIPDAFAQAETTEREPPAETAPIIDEQIAHGHSARVCSVLHVAEHYEPQQPADSVVVPAHPLPLTSRRSQDNVNEHAVSIAVEASREHDNGGIVVIHSRESFDGRSHDAGLRCNHSGCSYEGDFPRQWELQRHVASKHASERPFWCPVVGCIKGRSAPAFARPDKLTQHIRAVHHRGGARAVCPSGGCADMPLELDLLGVHVKRHHLNNKTQQEGASGKFLRAVINAIPTDRRNCPLWFCRMGVELDDFPAHLLTHTSEELGASADELAQEGYNMSKLGCEHGEHNMDPANPCHCEVTAVEPSCPVCASSCWDRQSLKAHIEEVHVWSGEDVRVFRQRILALIGLEAAQFLYGRVWSDVICPLRLNTQN